MDEIKDTLKPALSENVLGIVWKILVDEQNNLIAVESRDAENKNVYFSVFNYKTGATFFKNLPMVERWNLTIAHLGSDVLLIKVFPEEASPVSRGIIAVSSQTGRVIWEKHNIVFQQVWEEGLEVSDANQMPPRSSLIDPKTGIRIVAERRSAIQSSLLFPEQLDAAEVPSWLEKTRINGPPMYLKTNSRNIIAFHEDTARNLRLRLVVYQHFRILLDTILQEDIQKLRPETFFLLQNHLFCIRGNSTIVSYLV